MAKKKLLLIGAGPTSSLIVSCLGKSRLKDVFDIHVWEKDRCVGGRFSSFRSPKHENGCADLGAQYLTRSGDNKSEPYFSSKQATNEKKLKELINCILKQRLAGE